MVRDAKAYLVLHYVILIAIILFVIGTIDLYVSTIPLWAGAIIAIILGLLYPRFIVALGYGPKRWETNF